MFKGKLQLFGSYSELDPADKTSSFRGLSTTHPKAGTSLREPEAPLELHTLRLVQVAQTEESKKDFGKLSVSGPENNEPSVQAAEQQFKKGSMYQTAVDFFTKQIPGAFQSGYEALTGTLSKITDLVKDLMSFNEGVERYQRKLDRRKSTSFIWASLQSKSSEGDGKDPKSQAWTFERKGSSTEPKSATQREELLRRADISDQAAWEEMAKQDNINDQVAINLAKLLK